MQTGRLSRSYRDGREMCLDEQKPRWGGEGGGGVGGEKGEGRGAEAAVDEKKKTTQAVKHDTRNM